MNQLEERVLNEGKVIDGKYLKVNHFINHQIDTRLLNDISIEIYKLFGDLKISKIVTLESSGIAYAISAALYFDYCKVVFARKKRSIITTDYYESNVVSFTKNEMYSISIEKEFISSEDTILIIDDFLANGNAACGLIDLCLQANANVVGFCAIIEKSFQKGREHLSRFNIPIKSICIIESMEDGVIKLKTEGERK